MEAPRGRGRCAWREGEAAPGRAAREEVAPLQVTESAVSQKRDSPSEKALSRPGCESLSSFLRPSSQEAARVLQSEVKSQPPGT